MKKSAMIGGLTLTAIVATTGLALAQVKPEDVVKFRQGTYQVVRWHVGPLAAMAKGERPFDQDLAAKNATVIEQMSKVAADAFVPDSIVGNSRAKPEIWKERDKFKAAMTRFQTEAGKLAEVAKDGNFNAYKTQFGALTKACDNCHDSFRSK